MPAEEGRSRRRRRATSIRAPTTLGALAQAEAHRPKPDGTVTAGNASGVNDGACALHPRLRGRGEPHGLTPRARVVAVPPPASRRASWASARCRRRSKAAGAGAASRSTQIDVIELNEAFAAQALAVTARPRPRRTTTRTSTRTAARSRSATRSARAARGSSPTALYQLATHRRPLALARCASASARASR